MQQDPGSDRDVERLDTTRQGDTDPPVGCRVDHSTDTSAFIADDQQHRCPVRATPRQARRRFAANCRHPDLCPLEPSPGNQLFRRRGNGGKSEARTHAAANDLGIGQVGGPLQCDQTGSAKPQRCAEHGPDVSRVLHRVQHERGNTRCEADVIQTPGLRLDHCRYPLRVLRVGKGIQLGVGHLLEPDATVQQLRFQRLAAGSSFQRRRDGSTTNVEPGCQRLLHKPHSFGQRETAPFPSAASPEIPNQRLEGAGHADAHLMKIALTIAGSDSGGGAGIQADLKTFQQFGVFGTSVIVALTAQNTVGVRAVETVPEFMIGAQLTALAEDLPPAALKTGMLAEATVVRQVARAIRENGWAPLVVDPVMVSTSGARLLTTEAEDVIREDLLPLAALVTPNIDEAAILTGRVVHDLSTMERAAGIMLRFGAAAVLVKGGHISTPEVTDVLATPAGFRHFTHSRIETTSTHGTGCTLSAAITAGLALGHSLESAVEAGLDFVHRAIAAAPNLGAGHGPLNHTVPATAAQ